MAELDKNLSSAPESPIQGHALLNVKEIDGQYRITFNDGDALGEVNASLEKALANITEQQYQLDYEVFAPVRGMKLSDETHLMHTLTHHRRFHSDT